MKKHLTIVASAAIWCFAACTSKPEGGLSAAAQKNLDANDSVAKCFETKNFSKLGDYIATDAVDHSGEHGDIKGLDSMKAAFEKEMAGVDNMKSDLVKALADSDYVMAWYRFSGTWKKAEMGHKAGEPFDFKSLEVSRFKDGKAVEHWALMEPKDVMQMMSAMQPPAAPMADTTKKKKK
ncbi:ester cyclase [Puia dinghuensis]|uniref:Ester cyclase n=1 Tax=Puia dinghuensis TaxID=1792502 RepID=A0A8J2UIG8_9BACT|nr:ester cyclase [Puia dinghuensis]GGB22191.1 hypothetical protein GCM10011511_52580 [Puia dinghuensis]